MKHFLPFEKHSLKGTETGWVREDATLEILIVHRCHTRRLTCRRGVTLGYKCESLIGYPGSSLLRYAHPTWKILTNCAFWWLKAECSARERTKKKWGGGGGGGKQLTAPVWAAEESTGLKEAPIRCSAPAAGIGTEKAKAAILKGQSTTCSAETPAVVLAALWNKSYYYWFITVVIGRIKNNFKKRQNTVNQPPESDGESVVPVISSHSHGILYYLLISPVNK